MGTGEHAQLSQPLSILVLREAVPTISASNRDRRNHNRKPESCVYSVQLWALGSIASFVLPERTTCRETDRGPLDPTYPKEAFHRPTSTYTAIQTSQPPSAPLGLYRQTG